MMKEGLPSQPVRIIGFKSLPKAGDPIMCVESEEVAEELVETRAALKAGKNDRPDAPKANLEIHITGMKSRDSRRTKRVLDRVEIVECDGTIRIPIIVKAEADGSLSAVRESLVNLGKNSTNHKITIDTVLEGIGEITASDIFMAKESEAAIFAFGLKRIDQTILNLAESEDVTIRSNDIIYSLLDDAKNVLGSYLPRVPVEHVHGRAMVQAIFKVGTDGGGETVAGLRVTDGHMYKEKAVVDSETVDCRFRVLRDKKLISPEKGETASSLRRFKELVDSVRRGDECGLALSGFNEFKEGDEIECYSIQMKKDTL
jgi:translation initiation factor IF-2